MKLLLITLLLSLNLNAAVKVDIERGSKKYAASFETLEKANEWIEDNLSNNSWGKPERWVRSDSLPNTNDCIELRDIVPEEGKMFEECKLPKEYSIQVCDDSQTYDDGDPCKAVADDMKSKKAAKEAKETEKQKAKNIKKLKKKWSQLNDNQKDRLIKYLLRNL